MTWRENFAPIIAAVIRDVGTNDPGDLRLRRALRDAYPAGVRKYWPYKVWLDEIKRQTGQRPMVVKRCSLKDDQVRLPL